MTAATAPGLLTLAWSLYLAGMKDAALKALDSALETMHDKESVVEALELKVLMLRRSGALEKAANACDELARMYSDHPWATYAAKVLHGQAPPMNTVRSTPWPGPFCLMEQFLDNARHAELMNLVQHHESAFQPSTVGVQTETGRAPSVDMDQRVSLRLANIEPIMAWFIPLIENRLAEMIARCDAAPFAASEFELKCTAYADGHFFKVHSDNLYHVTRRLSFVYYFHRMPKPYTGGDLLIYDAKTTDATCHFPDRFTRIETRDNSLIVFPSELFHEVTPVVSTSGEFINSRFTLNGHIHGVTSTPLSSQSPTTAQ